MGMLIPGRAVLRAGIAVPLLCVAAALMVANAAHAARRGRRTLRGTARHMPRHRRSMRKPSMPRSSPRRPAKPVRAVPAPRRS